MTQTFTQYPYRCKLERGWKGARDAAERQDILVVVDTLSFSTTAVTAVHHGGIVYPCARDEDRFAFAHRVGAEAAVGRPDVPEKGRFSLSPLTYLNLRPGARIVIASPNGATCSRYARRVPCLLVGCLLNARAVAGVLSRLLQTTQRSISILSCGERWAEPGEDGPLRFAIEDDLGAGAILAHLDCEKSPEARVCEGAFKHVRHDLLDVLRDCGSGRELSKRGFGEDVNHAARLNGYDTVPAMHGESLVQFQN